MFIDRDFNIHDYKKITMEKYNLTEKQWKEVVELANYFRQCDDVTMFLPLMM